MSGHADSGLKSTGLLLLALALAGLLIAAGPLIFASGAITSSDWLRFSGPFLALVVASMVTYFGWRGYLERRDAERLRAREQEDTAFAAVTHEIGTFLDIVESIWWGIDRALESRDNASLSSARRGFTADSFDALPDVGQVGEIRLLAAKLDPVRQHRVLPVLSLIEQVFYLRRKLQGRPPLGVTPEQWQLQMFELCRIHFSHLADHARRLDPQFAARFSDRQLWSASPPGIADQLSKPGARWTMEEGRVVPPRPSA